MINHNTPYINKVLLRATLRKTFPVTWFFIFYFLSRLSELLNLIKSHPLLEHVFSLKRLRVLEGSDSLSAAKIFKRFWIPPCRNASQQWIIIYRNRNSTENSYSNPTMNRFFFLIKMKYNWKTVILKSDSADPRFSATDIRRI